MCTGKYGPTEPNFGYDFSAQFRASGETIYSPKLSTKLDAVLQNFPIDMTSERLIPLCLSKKWPEKKFLETGCLAIADEKSNLQILKSVKLTFLDTL